VRMEGKERCAGGDDARADPPGESGGGKRTLGGTRLKRRVSPAKGGGVRGGRRSSEGRCRRVAAARGQLTKRPTGRGDRGLMARGRRERNRTRADSLRGFG